MRLAQKLASLDDRTLSSQWASLLGPIVGKNPQELIAQDASPPAEDCEALKAEIATLRARIEVLLRTVHDLALR